MQDIVIVRDDYQAIIADNGDNLELTWTDYVGNEWIEHYPTLALALARAASLEQSVANDGAFSNDVAAFIENATAFLVAESGC